MRVLAIDPGYGRVGFAVLEKELRGKHTVLHSSCFTTSKGTPFPERLKEVGDETLRLINKYLPDSCAIEKLYFTANQKTAMAVSEARGVFLYLAAKMKLSVYEYTPLQIKSAVTGDGHGDKRQVAFMVGKLVDITKPIQYDDEYDAIAIAITCMASESNS